MEFAKFFLVLMAVVALTECQEPTSIQCFQCSTDDTDQEDCADPFDADKQNKYREACSARGGTGSTTCLKVVKGETVMRKCNTPVNATCSAAEVENPSGTFTYCCTGNACNSAGQLRSSAVLGMLTYLAGVVMLQL